MKKIWCYIKWIIVKSCVYWLLQLQDVNEQMLMDQYTRAPSRHEHEGKAKGSQPQGFVVRNAPWSSAVPDTNSTTDFPEFSATVEKKNPCSMAWGPSRKHWACVGFLSRQITWSLY